MEWASEHAVHLPRLVHLFNEYCKRYIIQPATQKVMLDILHSPTVAALLDLHEEEWSSVLVNDLYKAGMHKMYATYLSNVSADFALQVRRSPVTLACMARQRPMLFKALQEHVSALQSVQPYSPQVQRALSRYADGFTCSQEMLERAAKQGVAPVSWQAGDLPSGDFVDVCIASGPIEAASHVETTVLQLVQAAIIRYQVEELREQQGLTRHGAQECSSTSAAARVQECSNRVAAGTSHTEEHKNTQPPTGGASAQTHDMHGQSQHPSASSSSTGAGKGFGVSLAEPAGPSGRESERGSDKESGGSYEKKSERRESERGWWLDRSELLANSLAHLARVVDGLNSKDHGFELALFAGRRSSDRLFLVLQTLVFARLVKGYVGTSSLFVATLLDKAWDQVGLPLSERKLQLGKLLGTHAHEQSMLVQQLLAEFDNQAGAVSRLRGSGPVNVTALVAHLMHLAANGGLAGATALSDTYGSAGFVAVASVAGVPPAFIKIMEDVHRERVPGGAKCFDLFRVWRVDSGDYVAIVSHILEVWRERCTQLAAAGLPVPPAPQFIYSNLRDVEQILKLADLPTHLKPKTLAFGSLADGFLPFPKPPHAPSAGSQEGLQQGQEGLQRGQEGLQQGQEGLLRGQQNLQQGQEGLQRGQEGLQRGQEGSQQGQQGLLQGQEGLQRGQEGLQRGQEGLHRGQEGLQRGQQALQQGRQGLLQGQEGLQRGQESLQGGLEGLRQGHLQQQQQHKAYPNAAMSVGIGLGSIVMKAVQGYVCGQRSTQASALKLGDDPSEAKLILDPRIEPAEQPALIDAAREMARVSKADIDGPALSQVLSDAFEAGTTRFKDFCKQG